MSKAYIAEEPPYWVVVTTYLSYLVIFSFGHLRDFIDKWIHGIDQEKASCVDGYPPLLAGFEAFYFRHVFVPLRDCAARPVAGVPSREITLFERYSTDGNKTFQFTGKTKKCLNLSSYNYLGFAQAEGPCADAVEQAVRKYGTSFSSARNEVGTADLHVELERTVARFLGTEDAMCISMGFATNSTAIPALVSKGCLILSDELNHSSLVFGARLSNATIRVFKHNDPESLESVLREAISQGQPRTHRPWKKILVVVEGLYSMEGSIYRLPEIMALKEIYKFYLYVDEAHSIGALGKRGRGVCDYHNVDPRKVDILMGTFTKSFGAAGGYIAGSRALIAHMRTRCHAPVYAETIPTCVAQQIITSTKIMMGEDGTNDGQRRIAVLSSNSRYFSQQLRKRGFIIYGDEDSPVIPLMLFHPGKIGPFSRICLARGIAVVVVSAPATPMLLPRVRFCISAAHTKADLDYALKVVDEIGDELQLKLSSQDLELVKCMPYGSHLAEDRLKQLFGIGC
ncbi:pyridoxal phosphate-dependent transferase [Catenaria anguillulae PL171]|uniref:serine C-palmitoyltransferase n=1 Tax=Catenaria anguillulae PL171 TaxID=765915 RepID=A0A1Y2HPJ0_9FUNG|nr:pyridoxal phosphate-dependent transferase [Catenaria anguillulae PL171]